ncbi:hypothetical protein G6F57_020047 [Rhizopus arrhizus]|nr:hypothetical protein G6F57_020047 [Rhizopus arrhizus]
MLVAQLGDLGHFLGGVREDDGVRQHRRIRRLVAAVVFTHGGGLGQAVAKARAQGIQTGGRHRAAQRFSVQGSVHDQRVLGVGNQNILRRCACCAAHRPRQAAHGARTALLAGGQRDPAALAHRVRQAPAACPAPCPGARPAGGVPPSRRPGARRPLPSGAPRHRSPSADSRELCCCWHGWRPP